MDFGQKVDVVLEKGMRRRRRVLGSIKTVVKSLFVFGVCVVCRTTLHKMMGNFCAAWLDSVDLSLKDRYMIRNTGR